MSTVRQEERHDCVTMVSVTSDSWDCVTMVTVTSYCDSCELCDHCEWHVIV